MKKIATIILTIKINRHIHFKEMFDFKLFFQSTVNQMLNYILRKRYHCCVYSYKKKVNSYVPSFFLEGAKPKN